LLSRCSNLAIFFDGWFICTLFVTLELCIGGSCTLNKVNKKRPYASFWCRGWDIPFQK
jgi:hypothetical protein